MTAAFAVLDSLILKLLIHYY